MSSGTTPSIAIVIPAHNASTYLGEAIESARQQSYGNIRVLVVDDASTDDTPSIVNRYNAEDARVSLLSLSENQGPLAARLIAASSLASDYLLFLDADDQLFPEAVQRLLECAQARQADLVHAPMVSFSDADPELNLQGLDSWNLPLSSDDWRQPLDALICRDMRGWSSCGKLIHHDLMQRALSAFTWPPANLYWAEDLLLTSILLGECRCYAGCDSPSFRYRQGSGVTNRSVDVKTAERLVSSATSLELLGSYLKRSGRGPLEREIMPRLTDLVVFAVMQRWRATYGTDFEDAFLELISLRLGSGKSRNEIKSLTSSVDVLMGSSGSGLIIDEREAGRAVGFLKRYPLSGCVLIDSEQRLVGVFNSTDLARLEREGGTEANVLDFANRSPIHLTTASSAFEAYALMLGGRRLLTFVPVLEAGTTKLAGALAYRDLI
jgi:glycosyltransferase involved in cell wall biosynthesis/CBS domain-containing protein